VLAETHTATRCDVNPALERTSLAHPQANDVAENRTTESVPREPQQ